MREDDFRSDLATFVAGQPNKTQAAQQLKISRQDLYRYLTGKTEPHPERRRSMMIAMKGLARGKSSSFPPEMIQHLDVKSVTQMRDMLLHLVHLLDLDVASRLGK